MRKKILWAAAGICAAAACALAVWLTAGQVPGGRLASALPDAAAKPFADLEAADIAQATVTLSPPDLTVEIPDREELTELLRAVELREQDDSYIEYCGQGVTFTLRMADGSRVEATAFNPFFILDGTGYRTTYDPCEALNAYANGLLNQEDPRYFLESPPDLTVISDETALGALRGGYSWEYPLGDGTTCCTLADSIHPLDARDFLAGLDTTVSTAELHFNVEPQEIVAVRCWSDECWGNPGAESREAVLRGDTLELEPGGWIYEVEARWDLENGCGGTVSYAFYVVAWE